MSKRMLLWCLGIDLLFVVLHVLFGARVDLLNLDRERTPAAIFSALQFIASGYALFTVYFLSGTRSKKILWASLGLLFVLLGLDEVAELHENVAYYLATYVPPLPFFQSGTPMWIIFLSPLIIGVFVLLVFTVREIRANSHRAGRMLMGALVLAVCALVLEFLGGMAALNPLLPLFVVLEESAELAMGTLFLYAFSVFAREKYIARLN